MSDLHCVVKHFSELTASELLELAILRVSVFVVEQNCPYQEMDEQDRHAWHLWLYTEEAGTPRYVACSRFFLTTLDHFTEGDGLIMTHAVTTPKAAVAAFGRVAVHASYRHGGVGKRLVSETIAATQTHCPHLPIYIGAQAYLERFYGSFGFTTESNTFLEDNIPHVVMKRTAAVEAET